MKTVLVMFGVLLLIAAMAIELSAAMQFRKSKTTILPHRSATQLITGGPYRWSRNPIYVANTMLLVGAGLVFGIAWLIPAAIIAAALTHVLAVKREEAHLAKAFGSLWHDYANQVPRWLLF
jgi:protein-S-isoprenylcysteine O-methyltransferase Ste14